MVLALDGDSTMTSLVPPPLAVAAVRLLALALPVRAAVFVVPVFVVPVLGGTLFPSSHSRRDRPYRTLPVTRRPSAETIGPVRCVPVGSPRYTADLIPQVESLVNLSTIRPMAEYAYLVVYLPRGTSRDARDAARRILADHAEYGDWELSKLSLNADGSRKATLRRRIIRPVRTF